MPPPTGGDPAASGWTLISRVNSDAFFAVLPRVEWPAQLAVSITGKGGQIGRIDTSCGKCIRRTSTPVPLRP